MYYIFEGYSLDLQRQEFRRAGKLIPLRRKVFEMLAYLLAHHDRVVTRTELLDQLWPQQFIGDSTLNSCVREVRQAVDDNGRDQRIIRTVSGRGYRVIAVVEERTHDVLPQSTMASPIPEVLQVQETTSFDAAPMQTEDTLLRCRVCQHGNSAEAQFCNACLAPLASAVRSTPSSESEPPPDITQAPDGESEAVHDALTGLYNRQWLDTFVATLRDRGLLSSLPLSVAMVDIDYFKRFNDEYGHEVGDLTLRSLAQLLRQSVRPYDIVACFGGDEIIILLPSTPRVNAARLAEHLRERVAANRLLFDGQCLPSITISVGIAECRDAKRIDEAIREADYALYRAKRAGRNRISD